MPPTGDPSAHPPVGDGPSLADVLPGRRRPPRRPGRRADAGAAPRRSRRPVAPSSCSSTGSATTCSSAGPATRRSCASRLAPARAGPGGLPVDDGDVDGHLRHRPRRRGPRAASATRCSCRGRTGCSTSSPGRTAPTRCAGSRTRRSSSAWPGPGSTSCGSGPAYFDGSGLTDGGAARWPVRRGRHRCTQRVDATLAAVRAGAAGAGPPLLGRARQGRPRATAATPGSGATSSRRSTASWPGSRRACPTDCSLTITADHGMVDVPARAAGRRRRRAAARRRRAARRRARRARRSSTSSRAPATTSTPRGPSCSATGRSCSPARRPWPPAGSGRCCPRTCRGSVTSSSRRAAASPSSTPAGPARSCSPCVGLHGSLSDDEVAVPVVHVPRARGRLGSPLVAELVFFSGTMDCGKSTLALQMDHNNSARGRQGLIFTKLDRMGESVLSSRLGLSTRGHRGRRRPRLLGRGRRAAHGRRPGRLPHLRRGAVLHAGAGRAARPARRRAGHRRPRLRHHRRLPHRAVPRQPPPHRARRPGAAAPGRGAVLVRPQGHPQRAHRRRRHGRRGRAGRRRRHGRRERGARRVRGALPPALHAPDEQPRRPGGRRRRRTPCRSTSTSARCPRGPDRPASRVAESAEPPPRVPKTMSSQLGTLGRPLRAGGRRDAVARSASSDPVSGPCRRRAWSSEPVASAPSPAAVVASRGRSSADADPEAPASASSSGSARPRRRPRARCAPPTPRASRRPPRRTSSAPRGGPARGCGRGRPAAAARRRGSSARSSRGSASARGRSSPGVWLGEGRRRERRPRALCSRIAAMRSIGSCGARSRAAPLDATVGVDVVDVEVARRGGAVGRRDRAGRGVLAEPAGLVVGRGDRAAEGLVAPGRGALAARRPGRSSSATRRPRRRGRSPTRRRRASTPRSRSRSATRSARVTGPVPRLPTAHCWAIRATCSRSARTGPSKRRTFSTVQPARSATSSVDRPRRMRACTSRGRRPPSISIWS